MLIRTKLNIAWISVYNATTGTFSANECPSQCAAISGGNHKFTCMPDAATDAAVGAQFSDLNSAPLWVGLTDVAEEGTFRCTDTGAIAAGAPTHTWKPGGVEPNNFGGTEHCVLRYHDGLRDVNCNMARRCLCIRPASNMAVKISDPGTQEIRCSWPTGSGGSGSSGTDAGVNEIITQKRFSTRCKPPSGLLKGGFGLSGWPVFNANKPYSSIESAWEACAWPRSGLICLAPKWAH
jgi:hypothetical protein